MSKIDVVAAWIPVSEGNILLYECQACGCKVHKKTSQCPSCGLGMCEREAITQEEFDDYCKKIEIVFGVDAKTGKPIKRNRGKYKQGERITSLDDLRKQTLIMVYGKVYHRGWWDSWQYHYLEWLMDTQGLYKVVEKGKENG